MDRACSKNDKNEKVLTDFWFENLSIHTKKMMKIFVKTT
jgi:hypothetical protein